MAAYNSCWTLPIMYCMQPNAYQKFEYLEYVELKQSDDTGEDENQKNDDVIIQVIPLALCLGK